MEFSERDLETVKNTPFFEKTATFPRLLSKQYDVLSYKMIARDLLGCSPQVGFIVIFEHFSGFEFSLLPSIVQARPLAVTQTIRRLTDKLMLNFSHLETLSKATASILRPPFEWCHVEGGNVFLEDVSQNGGTKGGFFQINNLAIAKYPITNAQYERFLENSNGFSNPSGGNILPKRCNGGKIMEIQNPPLSMVLICLAHVSAGLIVWPFVIGYLLN